MVVCVPKASTVEVKEEWITQLKELLQRQSLTSQLQGTGNHSRLRLSVNATVTQQDYEVNDE